MGIRTGLAAVALSATVVLGGAGVAAAEGPDQGLGQAQGQLQGQVPGQEQVRGEEQIPSGSWIVTAAEVPVHVVGRIFGL